MQHRSKGGRQISAKNRITVNLEDEYHTLEQVADRAARSLAWLGRRVIPQLLQWEFALSKLGLPPENTASARSERT